MSSYRKTISRLRNKLAEKGYRLSETEVGNFRLFLLGFFSLAVLYRLFVPQSVAWSQLPIRAFLRSLPSFFVGIGKGLLQSLSWLQPTDSIVWEIVGWVIGVVIMFLGLGSLVVGVYIAYTAVILCGYVSLSVLKWLVEWVDRFARHVH